MKDKNTLFIQQSKLFISKTGKKSDNNPLFSHFSISAEITVGLGLTLFKLFYLPG